MQFTITCSTLTLLAPLETPIELIRPVTQVPMLAPSTRGTAIPSEIWPDEANASMIPMVASDD